MKTRFTLFTLCAIITLPISAQLFNFSLRTNNQQLIDEALSGAFVKINQQYELCDTVKNEYFGLAGKDYFNIIPFIGVETERGLIYPLSAETPWVCDKDFIEYEDQYKPIVSKSSMLVLNSKDNAVLPLSSPLIGEKIKDDIALFNNSIYTNIGLKVDTISGNKEGWIIWFSSADNLVDVDSVRFTSVRKTIDVPIDGSYIILESPDIPETIYGGIYVTSVQTAIGQITFYLTGFMISDEDSWKMFFPFIGIEKEPKLTPITDFDKSDNQNPFKKKKEKKRK